MSSWISGRFSTSGSGADSPERSESVLMARTGAALYASGATLALVWLLLPHPIASNDAVLVGVVTVAYIAATLMWWGGDRLTLRQWELVVALGIGLISIAITVSGRTTTPFVLFYLWSNFYAWYFFPRRRAILQLGLTGGAYAAVLLFHDKVGIGPSGPGILPLFGPGAARWLITVGTMAVAGVLVAALRQRVERLIRELTEERNFVVGVVDTAAALVMIFGLDGRLQACNRACERITGYSGDDIRGSHISEFMLLPDELERARAEWDLLVESGGPREFDFHLVTKDGEHRLIAWSAVLVPDAAGVPDHVVATGVDVTELKRGERELRRHAARQAAVAEPGPQARVRVDRRPGVRAARLLPRGGAVPAVGRARARRGHRALALGGVDPSQRAARPAHGAAEPGAVPRPARPRPREARHRRSARRRVLHGHRQLQAHQRQPRARRGRPVVEGDRTAADRGGAPERYGGALRWRRVRRARRGARGRSRRAEGGGAPPGGPRPAVRARRRGALPDREHRRGACDRPLRRAGGPDARRRRRHVPRQGSRARGVRALRLHATEPGDRPAPARERAARSDRARRAGGRLPADR